MVCIFKNTLYTLKQEPRAQYARLDKYLTSLGFVKGNDDRNLYLTKNDNDLLIFDIFVDGITFRGNNEENEAF